MKNYFTLVICAVSLMFSSNAFAYGANGTFWDIGLNSNAPGNGFSESYSWQTVTADGYQGDVGLLAGIYGDIGWGSVTGQYGGPYANVVYVPNAFPGHDGITMSLLSGGPTQLLGASFIGTGGYLTQTSAFSCGSFTSNSNQFTQMHGPSSLPSGSIGYDCFLTGLENTAYQSFANSTDEIAVVWRRIVGTFTWIPYLTCYNHSEGEAVCISYTSVIASTGASGAATTDLGIAQTGEICALTSITGALRTDNFSSGAYTYSSSGHWWLYTSAGFSASVDCVE